MSAFEERRLFVEWQRWAQSCRASRVAYVGWKRKFEPTHCPPRHSFPENTESCYRAFRQSKAERKETQNQAVKSKKTRFPNFFAPKLLISHNSAKNSFGKVWKSKFSFVENKGFFGRPLRRRRSFPRFPRFSQMLTCLDMRAPGAARRPPPARWPEAGRRADNPGKAGLRRAFCVTGRRRVSI